ncbi:Uu.00g145280.m01.CDS01 [Anthostomella pinea]|uniref:Uu.00g145280.m01.CDS01 n=1 Tax=Anthostomella pinea TaxID=933095 RepID=A0AAI8VR17_9PEZI|nr:Uu.00g145280.m01.CDS01 [Anthostomella pinea]
MYPPLPPAQLRYVRRGYLAAALVCVIQLATAFFFFRWLNDRLAMGFFRHPLPPFPPDQSVDYLPGDGILGRRDAGVDSECGGDGAVGLGLGSNASDATWTCAAAYCAMQLLGWVLLSVRCV